MNKSPLYVCRYLSKESAQDVSEVAKEIGLKDLVPINKMHTTIVYSSKEVEWSPDMADQDDLLVGGLILFIELSGHPVIALSSMELQNRHYNLNASLEASYDFPTYTPHVTMSYTTFQPEFTFKGRGKAIILPKPIVFTKEVWEPLQ